MRARITRTLLLALGVSGSAPLVGCQVQTRGAVVVDAPPPPPRHVHVEARPGYVWVDGYWVSRGAHWAWRDGHWERGRPGHIYVQGTWARRAGRWHWVEPRWERRAHRGRVRGHVELRDDRGEPAPARRRRAY